MNHRVYIHSGLYSVYSWLLRAVDATIASSASSQTYQRSDSAGSGRTNLSRWRADSCQYVQYVCLF